MPLLETKDRVYAQHKQVDLRRDREGTYLTWQIKSSRIDSSKPFDLLDGRVLKVDENGKITNTGSGKLHFQGTGSLSRIDKTSVQLESGTITILRADEYYPRTGPHVVIENYTERTLTLGGHRIRLTRYRSPGTHELPRPR